MTGLVVPVPVKLPGLEVTVYPVIAEPPLLTGTVNDTVAWTLPDVAVPIVGAPGTVEVTAVVVKITSLP